MSGHRHAIGTLAAAFHVKAKFLHRFIVESQILLALVEAILDRMRRNTVTMFACAHAQTLLMRLKRAWSFVGGRGFRQIKIDDCFESCIMGLSILTIASLNVDCTFGGSQFCGHKPWWRFTKWGPFFVVILRHRVLIYPHDRPKTLNVLRFLILYKISNKKALLGFLSKLIMTFCRTGCCAASCAKCCRFFALNTSPTGAL